MVDSNGNVKATIMANKSGQGAQTLTSEHEIMRGDLVRKLNEAIKDNVHYMFGITVDSFDQDEKQVISHFSDGSSGTYDILVGADDQGSHIRRAILSPDSPDPYYRLGTHVACYFIPVIKSDTNMKTVYNCTGGRMIIHRSHSPTETQVLLFLSVDSPEISSLSKASMEQQKAGLCLLEILPTVHRPGVEWVLPVLLLGHMSWLERSIGTLMISLMPLWIMTEFYDPM